MSSQSAARSCFHLIAVPAALCISLLAACQCGAQRPRSASPLDRAAITARYFHQDAAWYAHNIPLLEIDDPAIQQAYYYRWQVYRSHIREIGPQGTDVTEFLPSVPWSRHPWEDLNDSSAFHIAEGRWLRNPQYVHSLVDHLFTGAGNDRHFSEWIAAAILGWVQVTGDPRPALQHLDSMQYVFNAWDDHFDAERGVYWIEPLADATEYTIASIDASGAGFTDAHGPDATGFTGGYAFRPTINAYQYGNARAIAALAAMAGQTQVAEAFTQRAQALRQATLAQLWNPRLHYFTDIYQRSTKFVTAGDFIRGRELAGLVPWQFDLPPLDSGGAAPDYNGAWSNALSPNHLGGPYGLRTVEPTYARYLTQYRYDAATGLDECQWNGPSWPFQTSEALTGLAHLLHNSQPSGITPSAFVHLLRQYTAQHRLANGTLDLQEDYNPDTGRPIVGLPRSHHYLHSTYNDLVLSGLVGILPHSDNLLEISPLLPEQGAAEPPIRYFAVQGLLYHGHDLTSLYDADGTRYHLGHGLIVFSDGERLRSTSKGLHFIAKLQPKTRKAVPLPIDLAVNVWAKPPSTSLPYLPIASASSTAQDAKLYDPLDGRLWFFPEIPHGWSPQAITNQEDWFAVDLRRRQTIGSVQLSFFSDGTRFAAPDRLRLQAKSPGGDWTDIALQSPATTIANGPTQLTFAPLEATELRLSLARPQTRLPPRLVAFRVFAPQPR